MSKFQINKEKASADNSPLILTRGLWGTTVPQPHWLILAGLGLFKGREILEGSNIFIENSMSPLKVNWCVPKT